MITKILACIGAFTVIGLLLMISMFITLRIRLSANFWEALNTVIKALEQESCEDAISRQVVNELFDSEIKMYKERIETRKGSNYHDETERIKEFRSRIANAEYWQNKIKALPPITHTRKKGKWEYDAYKDRNDGHCNQCGHYMRYGAKTKFCPDCGAEMESE